MNAYVGRFAPSPTGPLHFGSLIAAVASYCDAKANNGMWLVRMEDLDKPREMIGAADNILDTLNIYGFTWDKDVVYQSQRVELYQHALNQLQTLNKLYGCICSRKEIADSAIKIGIEGAIYPRTCINKPTKPNGRQAWRIKTTSETITFNDRIQGVIKQNLAEDIGDFVLKRADGLYAYQLAVVVDDAVQKVTHVVRGADLLNSTTRQIYLQRCLNYPTLEYAHVPVASNANSEKLSKQTLAKALDQNHPLDPLWLALDFLQQAPPTTLKNKNISALWDWAIAHWDITKIEGISKTITDDRLVSL
jgi:glutamyl-Q tRNA(Asp) synthetase